MKFYKAGGDGLLTVGIGGGCGILKLGTWGGTGILLAKGDGDRPDGNASSSDGGDAGLSKLGVGAEEKPKLPGGECPGGNDSSGSGDAGV